MNSKEQEKFLSKGDIISELRDIRNGMEKLESQFSALEAELKFLTEKLDHLNENAHGDSISFHKY